MRGAGSVNRSPGVSRSSTGGGGGVSLRCTGWEVTDGMGVGAAGDGMIEAVCDGVIEVGFPKIAERTKVPKEPESLSGVQGSP